MHKALHPRDDVDRLYVSRNEEGNGLAGIKDSVGASLQRHEDYIEKYEGWLITAIRNDTDNAMTNRMTITRKRKWEEKQLYGRFKRLISNISFEKTWIRKGNLKRETESLQKATQNNAIRTNLTEARIDKMQENSKCILCGDRDETINHIISECSKLARQGIRLDTTGWARLSADRWARNWNLTIWTKGIGTTEHQFWKMTHINSYISLTSKRITKSRPEDQTS